MPQTDYDTDMDMFAARLGRCKTCLVLWGKGRDVSAEVAPGDLCRALPRVG